MPCLSGAEELDQDSKVGAMCDMRLFCPSQDCGAMGKVSFGAMVIGYGIPRTTIPNHGVPAILQRPDRGAVG